MMAKYDWKQLEKEFILSDFKSVSAFFENKGIPNNSRNRSNTKGWKEKKWQKSDKKVTKTIEKVIEKESEKEAQQIVDIKAIANDLALKVIESRKELNMHIARNKKKTKTVEYDYMCNKPSKETIEEKEEIKSYIDIIDRQGLKQLTSALKDLNDILTDKKENGNDNQSLADAIQKAYETKVGGK
jgi:hypothetical protein